MARRSIAQIEADARAPYARTIATLTEERATLRAALSSVLSAWTFISGGDHPHQMRDAMQKAREALERCQP